MTILFTATDPRNFLIECSIETWENHILDTRPFMVGWEGKVKKAIEKPFTIYEDVHFSNRQVYYYIMSKSKLYYLRVVVRLTTQNSGEVITAFPADSGKQGEKLIWPTSSD